jgi:hypothetical protein
MAAVKDDSLPIEDLLPLIRHPKWKLFEEYVRNRHDSMVNALVNMDLWGESPSAEQVGLKTAVLRGQIGELKWILKVAKVAHEMLGDEEK